MPRTDQTHEAAAGKPVGAYRVTFCWVIGRSFAHNRDLHAKALRQSRWFQDTTDGGRDTSAPLYTLWDELQGAEDRAAFERVLDRVHDQADDEGCTIITFRG